MKEPLQLFFADSDERINPSWAPYGQALKAAGVKFEAIK